MPAIKSISAEGDEILIVFTPGTARLIAKKRKGFAKYLKAMANRPKLPVPNNHGRPRGRKGNAR